MRVDCTVNSCVWGIIRYSTEEGEGLMASLSYVPRDICFVFDDIDDSLFTFESLPTYLPACLPTYLHKARKPGEHSRKVRVEVVAFQP